MLMMKKTEENKRPLIFMVICALILIGCTMTPAEMAVKEGSSIKTLTSGYDGACLKVRDSFNFSGPGSSEFRPVGTTLLRASNSINAATAAIFNAIIGPGSDFNRILRLSMVLMIVFYGLAMIMGVANLSANEVLTRIIKIGVILALVSSWTFFSTYVVQFFNTLTDDFIRIFTDVFMSDTTKKAIDSKTGLNPLTLKITGKDAVADARANYSLAVIDRVIYTLFSMRFWRVFWGMIFTGEQGLGYAIFMLLIVIIYMLAIFRAVYMYIIALIAKALLFSLAPIFLTFLLFNQTKSLFDGWLRQLVNFSLQPILIFAFVAFFTGLIFITFAAGFGTNRWLCFSGFHKIKFWQTLLTLLFPILGVYIAGFMVKQRVSAQGIITAMEIAIRGTGAGAAGAVAIAATCIKPPTAMATAGAAATTYINTVVAGAARAAGMVAANGQSALMTFLFKLGFGVGGGFLGQFLGSQMDSLPAFRISNNWWRFYNDNGTGNAPAQGAAAPIVPDSNIFGLSDVPLPFSTFLIIFLLAYLMWRMGDWARDTASMLSDGVVAIPSNMPGAGAVMSGIAGIGGTAGRIVGTGANLVAKGFAPRTGSGASVPRGVPGSGPTISGGGGGPTISGGGGGGPTISGGGS